MSNPLISQLDAERLVLSNTSTVNQPAQAQQRQAWHIEAPNRKLSCTQTGCKFCARPRQAMEKRELSSCSWPCPCSNDSDSCHYQEEEKLKLGCESVGNQQRQKNWKHREDSCQVWLKPKVYKLWRDCGGPENQQLGLSDTTRAHAYSVWLGFAPPCSNHDCSLVKHTRAKFLSVLQTHTSSCQCPSRRSQSLSAPVFSTSLAPWRAYMLCLNWATCLTSGL